MSCYINRELCAQCGGECCNWYPGVAFPEDFDMKTSSDKLEAALRSGKYVVDFWDNEFEMNGLVLDTPYFVRPAMVGEEGLLVSAGWIGKCTFHTPTGCSLLPDERPSNCRYVEPISLGNCKLRGNYDKPHSIVAWHMYEVELNTLVQKLRNERR